MRALLVDSNRNLRVALDHPKPRPTADETLLAVRLAGVCATDLAILNGYMSFTGVLGHEFVARAVGGVYDGQRVACEINCVCGNCPTCQSGLRNHCNNRSVIGIHNHDGAFAEFLAAPTVNLHPIPDSVDDATAVFIEPLAAAVQITKQVKLEPKHRVAVLGGGRLGCLVAQVVATQKCQLVVIGRNRRKLAHVEKRGIYARSLQELIVRPEHDVVIDCTDNPDGIQLAMQLVRPRGTIVLKSTAAEGAPLNLSTLVVDEVTLIGSRCGPFGEAINLLATKQIDVSGLITRVVPLSGSKKALDLAADPEQMKVLIDPTK